MKKRLPGLFSLVIIILLLSSCQPAATPLYFPLPTVTITSTPPATQTAWSSMLTFVTTPIVPVTTHIMRPADLPPSPGTLIYDVTSARRAAPYGDSYDINRLERPFQQDTMRYIPDVDIITFSMSEDQDWYYVFIELSGDDPNHSRGIDYGVELDQDRDGFGDLLVWSYPPYSTEWSTTGARVFSDSNHDTAGASSSKSDAASTGNGYDSLVFNGAEAGSPDPDVAWVRMQEGPGAVIQFAFKRTLLTQPFLFGALADAGVKDITKYDYNDHFLLADAGSPIRNSMYYPLKQLFAFDNTCWQAYGMKNPYTVSKVCPPGEAIAAPTRSLETAVPTTYP